jgi:hypothetical protein
LGFGGRRLERWRKFVASQADLQPRLRRRFRSFYRLASAQFLYSPEARQALWPTFASSKVQARLTRRASTIHMPSTMAFYAARDLNSSRTKE